MIRKLQKDHEVRYENLRLKGGDGRRRKAEVVANIFQENGRAVIWRTLSTAVWVFITCQPTETPRTFPINAVTAMAKAPPIVTRNAARPSGAPPR